MFTEQTTLQPPSRGGSVQVTLDWFCCSVFPVTKRMHILYALLYFISEEFEPLGPSCGSQIKTPCLPVFVLALEGAGGELGK